MRDKKGPVNKRVDFLSNKWQCVNRKMRIS